MAVRKEDLIAPVFGALDAGMRSKLLRKLAAGWPSKQPREVAVAKQHAAGGQQQSERLMEAVLASCLRTSSEKDLPSLIGCSDIVFGDGDGDIMRPNDRGVMRFNDTMYRMAGSTFALLRPVLQEFSFEASAAGLAQLLATLWHLSDKPRLAEQLTRSLYSMIMGGEAHISVPDMNFTLRFTSHMIWMGLMSGCLSYSSTWLFYLQHLGLPPLDRAWRSAPRTMAFVELVLQPIMDMLGCWRKPRVMWVVGATDAVEGKQAREGLFEDLRAFRDAKVAVHLIGEDFGPSVGAKSSLSVEVHGHHYAALGEQKVPSPTLVFCLHSGLGTLDPALGELLRFVVGLSFTATPPLIVSTSRSEAEARAELCLLHACGVHVAMPTQHVTPVRNLYSGMAGHPDIDYDDHGWWVSYCGSKVPAEVRPGIMGWLTNSLEEVFAKTRALLEPEAPPAPAVAEPPAEAAAAEAPAEAAPPEAPPAAPAAPEEAAAGAAVAEEPAQAEVPALEAAKQSSKSPAVFWGILDLKYDPRRLPGDRVKVLETGDGRTSRFSGYGASIKETFQQENRLEETLHRAVLTENKKLTHDTIVDAGYGHLRPRQIPFPKEYKPDLAETIVAAFGFSRTDSCVLKLCNRTRGAGVIPVRVAELDESLELLLQPPTNVEAWLKEQPADWARTVTWGCTEEQLRHWWSNECPLFVVEDLIFSVPTEKDGRQLDGTMRVGFSLHREERRVRLEPVLAAGAQGPESDSSDNEGTVRRMRRDVMQEAAKVWDKDRPYMDLFRPDYSILRVQWLGGYWKLPTEDIWSDDLRAKVVSVAKQGTAPVSSYQLHEVYAGLGDMVARLFEAKDMSNASLLRRYGEWPEFGAFAVSRLACSMRARDRTKSFGLLQLAHSHLSKCVGVTKDLVHSYIVRNYGVHQALQGSWQSAQEEFVKAVRLMPCNATARFLLGIAQMELGRPEAAVASMEEALMLDPDFKAPYACLGVLRLRRGEYQKAADISRAGLTRHPYTPQCSYNLGLSSFALACLREETFSKLWTAPAKLPPAPPAVTVAASGQLQAAAPAKQSPAARARPLTVEGRYEVAHRRILIRAEPSRSAKVAGTAARGRPMYGTPHEVDGEAWLCLRKGNCKELNVQASEAWILMDGKDIGLGPLITESPAPVGTEVVVKVRHEEKEGTIQLRTATSTTIEEVRRLVATELGKPSFSSPLYRKVGTEFFKCEDNEPLGACLELMVRGKATWSLPKLPRQEAAPAPAEPAAGGAGARQGAAPVQGASAPERLRLRSEAVSDPLLQSLRTAALESLETARTSRTRDLSWTERDDRLLARLREPGLLEWPREELPRDGWRVLNYRP